MPTIVIQNVVCVWTKRSRGGEGARLRNSIPSAVATPEYQREFPYLLQTVIYSEYDNFTQNSSVTMSGEFSDLGLQDLSVMQEPDSVIIRFIRDGNNAACPNPFPHKDVFTLQRQCWGRVVYNGRYVDRCSGNWWYKQSTYNIGYFDRFPINVFTATCPLNLFQEMATLI